MTSRRFGTPHHRVAEKLGTKTVIATSGNHDLDSRFFYSDYDAKGVLQALRPRYPFADDAVNDRYWARNFAIETIGKCRIVALNSAAYHGFRDESTHGRVANSTIAQLKEVLETGPAPAANVLVCHHHLFRFGDMDLPDYSEMKGGELLLDLLGSGEHGRWLVIHGHRHWPHVTYGPGSATSPVIFAAGSFTGMLYPELMGRVRNQFYLVDMPVDNFATLGLGLVGEFQAWDWIVNGGWKSAQDGSGLPHRGGFGSRQGGDLVSDRVAKMLADSGRKFMRWDEICASEASLRYLVPADLALCIGFLRDRYGLNVEKEDGYPSQVGKL